MKQIFFEDVDIDTEIPISMHRVDLLQLVKYAAATWNLFLLHIDKEFAQKQGFRDANIPASLYGAFLTKMVVDWIGNTGLLKKLGYRVIVMGFPGDVLVCRGMVVKKHQRTGENLVDCDIWVENQDKVKVALGSATVSLLSKGV
jgi:acyl dehydratase